MKTDIYQTIARQLGAIEWRPVTYHGQNFYSDENGLNILHNMTQIMISRFPMNEYTIERVAI